MSTSNEELLNSIQNYQRSLDKCESLCYAQKIVLQEIQSGKENAVDASNDAACADKYISYCHEKNSDKKISNNQDVGDPNRKHRKSKISIDGYITKRHHDSSDFESKGDIYEGKHNKSSKRNRGNECSGNEEERHETKKYRHSKDSSDSKSYKKQRSFKSSSKQKSSLGIKKDIVKRPKPANSENIINGVDSSSGTSFTEVLGMCGQRISKSSSSIKNKSSSLANYEKPRSSPRCMAPDYSSVNSSRDSPPKGVLSQDETLSQFVSNKTRTKICTGKRSPKNAETLFDVNINALKHTGGAPYLTLTPVLEKATPNQLFNVEHQIPYLLEDTDGLWQLHCRKEFRNKKREELGSWREMYMRCLNEREERLNAVTAKIKQSQNKSMTIRTTKLAYIDSSTKPSRDIARKQAKNDATEPFYKKPAQTPAPRLAALASQADTGKVTASNPERNVVDRPIRKTVATVKTKAPLMAKTLLFMKNRFKR